MRTGRLEAFSDGVLAFIITIMVLELHLPEEGRTIAQFWHTAGLGLLTYLLSFVYIGIYWSNHHHLFQLVHEVDGLVVWANLHLLFWLSLMPLTQRWLDESSVAREPTALYGVNLLGAAVAYYLLQPAIAAGLGLPDAFFADAAADLAAKKDLLSAGLEAARFRGGKGVR